MASLERIAAYLQTILAAHVAFQFMDRCGLRPADDMERNGLVVVAGKAANFEIAVSRIECVTERRRWLRRAFVTKHALIPGIAGELVGLVTRFLGALCRSPGRTAVYRLAGFSAHGWEDAPANVRFTSR